MLSSHSFTAKLNGQRSTVTIQFLTVYLSLYQLAFLYLERRKDLPAGLPIPWDNLLINPPLLAISAVQDLIRHQPTRGRGGVR